jgi:hypothetical protein
VVRQEQRRRPTDMPRRDVDGTGFPSTQGLASASDDQPVVMEYPCGV